MRVSLTIAADDRKFSKAFSRVYPQLNSLTADLSSCEMVHPVGERIVVIVTDTEVDGYYREDFKDGDFTFFIGISPIADDLFLKHKLFSILAHVFENMPFTNPDREQYRGIFSQWESRFE